MTEPKWYDRTLRWGQTNLTEIDPQRYDSEFWKAQWAATKIGGVIVNAGGIVAYYPSEFPQHRAIGLGDGDLYGDIVRDAREAGLAVIARMDSSRAEPAFFDEHPDWATRDAQGAPYMAGPNVIACINSGYYTEFLPAVFSEIIERSHPDGFADNSWAGLPSSKICYCENCRAGFRAAFGHELPEAHDWASQVYRDWIRWNDARRTEVWAENTRRTMADGGPDCVWVGMLSGDQLHLAERFTNVHDIGGEASIFFVDHQRRVGKEGFTHNADTGKRFHGVLGWNRLMPESMAMYSAGTGFFRATSMPAAEVRLWSAEGFAGGIQPWWHHISAVHEDRRQYATPLPIFDFHSRNEKYLVDRTPRAQVAVVWTEKNLYFHGRGRPGEVVVDPYRGATSALVRARIPYLGVHLDDLDALDESVRLVVLPDIAVMTEAEAESIRSLAARGVSILATGQTSLQDPEGERRQDFLLSDVLGVHATGEWHGDDGPLGTDIEVWERHDYLRFDRSGSGSGVGPDDIRAILDPLGDTDIVSFGGRLERVTVADGATAMTYVEPFPFYPPEFAWLPSEPTTTPGLVLRKLPSGARIAYLPADLDRIAGRERRPDAMRLLGSIARWQLGDDRLLDVTGVGEIDCNLYAQPGRLILHLVQTPDPTSLPGSIDELVPVGPFTVEISDPSLSAATPVQALVGRKAIAPDSAADGRIRFTVPRIEDHEIVVIGSAD